MQRQDWDSLFIFDCYVDINWALLVPEPSSMNFSSMEMLVMVIYYESNKEQNHSNINSHFVKKVNWLIWYYDLTKVIILNSLLNNIFLGFECTCKFSAETFYQWYFFCKYINTNMIAWFFWKFYIKSESFLKAYFMNYNSVIKVKDFISTLFFFIALFYNLAKGTVI